MNFVVLLVILTYPTGMPQGVQMTTTQIGSMDICTALAKDVFEKMSNPTRRVSAYCITSGSAKP